MKNAAAVEPNARRLEISLPSGATFPQWSAVTSENARRALEAIFEALDVKKFWAGMGDGEDRVRRAILDHYGRSGHAPSIAQLAELGGVEGAEARAIVEKLRERDLVVLEEGGEAIVGAYPFSERDTGHRVRLGEQDLNAMCAIDALGAGAMLGTDAVIESACRECGAAIRIATRGGGAALAAVSPRETVVWSGIRYEGRCAADSLCTVIAFFCSDGHLEARRAVNQPDTRGFRLSVDEGLEAGRAIFAPMLAEPHR